MPTTDQAICVRAVDYSETSQVISVLTREAGLVRLIAKGSKRPKSRSGGRVDLLAEGSCVFSAGRRESLGVLIEFAETKSHSGLRTDLPTLNAALYMLELCGELLAEADPHPEVFDLLHSGLDRLARARPAVVLAYFHYRLLRLVGLLGQMNACASCKGPPGTVGVCFSSGAGGLLCRGCESAEAEKLPVPGAALAGLAALAAVEAGRRPKISDKQALAVLAVLTYHSEYQLGKRLKTAGYVVPRSRPRRSCRP